jgi:hypothetical protein
MARPKGSKNEAKTKSDVPGAAGVAGVGHNSKPEHNLTPDDQRKLFLHHRTKWNELQAKQAVVDKIAIDVKAALKKDGFTVKEMQIADALGDLKGEARIQDDVKTRLQVARWMGHPLGAQLDLFADGKAAIVGDPYDLGKMASMEDRPAKPQDHGYAPDSEQHGRYMAGYQDHQRELAGGIKAPATADQSTMAHRDDEKPPTETAH